LIGIDYRPANILLYGVTDTNGIYTINADTAANSVSTLSLLLPGCNFRVDFNPVVIACGDGANDQLPRRGYWCNPCRWSLAYAAGMSMLG